MINTILTILGSSRSGGESYQAINGSASFVMSDIPLENMTKPLLLSYSIPAAGNLSLLVFIHGWDGGDGLGGINSDAITMLGENGIGIMSVGMRGRNDEVENYRDASALEIYDVYATIQHLVNNIASPGQINTNKIVIYGSSGGGGNSLGIANKFPELCSVIIDWYGMGKYGTYTGDPDSGFTGWYTDNVNYQGGIQNAIGDLPLGTGVGDSYFLARDHFRGVTNFKGKMYNYHNTTDNFVKPEHSYHLETIATAASMNFTQYISSNGDYAHGKGDIFTADYNPGVYGLQWLNDAKTLTRQLLPSSGTLHVAGYVFTDDFKVWMKKIRKNVPVQPRAAAYLNQGKSYASTLVYDKGANTYQITPIIPSTSEQFVWADVTTSTGYAIALLSASDVVTLTPKTLNKQPLSLSHSCKLYYDFSDTDGYYLDDASKYHTIIDLTGNKNLAFNSTRANRVNHTSGYLDNGIYYQRGASGTLSASFDNIQLTGAMTLIISVDPDAAAVGSLTSQGLVGRGSGGQTNFTLGNFSGKVQVTFQTNTVFAQDATPSNSNVGKQVWAIIRDVSNNVTITCLNSSNTYTYSLGLVTGIFELRTLGSGTSTSKQFSGKIYKLAVYDQDIGSTDAAAIQTSWYNAIP